MIDYTPAGRAIPKLLEMEEKGFGGSREQWKKRSFNLVLSLVVFVRQRKEGRMPKFSDQRNLELTFGQKVSSWQERKRKDERKKS